MEKKTLLMLFASVFLMLMLLAAAYYKVQLSKTKSQNIIFQAEPDLNCDLQKSVCRVSIPGDGEISFSIEPRPIPLVTRINLNVGIKSIKAEAVSVDFQGTSMNMGPNNVALKSEFMGEGHSSFQGTGMLPVCIRNSMQWKAQVYVQTDEGIIVAPFIFVTHK
jgi:hypothetical protein